jgi:hypothetical protein
MARFPPRWRIDGESIFVGPPQGAGAAPERTACFQLRESPARSLPLAYPVGCCAGLAPGW